MTTPIADIQIRSSLIDDYLEVAEAPIASDLARRFLVVQAAAEGPPVSQLVTVGPSGQLVHFTPDTTSHSGWASTTVAVTPPSGATSTAISRLAGFYACDTLNVLAYFPIADQAEVASWMQRGADGDWSEAALTNDAKNALGFTYQTDLYVSSSGTAYLYGVTEGLGGGGAFFLVSYDSGNDCWDILYEQYLQAFSTPLSMQTAFRLMPGSGTADFTVMWVDGTEICWQGAYLDEAGDFNWADGGPRGFDPGVGLLTVDQIITMPGALASSHFLLRAGSGTLALVSNYTDASAAFTPLTGAAGQPAGVTSASVGIDPAGMLMLLGVEQDSQALWIQRQNGVDALGEPSFDNWVSLGGTFDTLGCPAQMLAGAEAFTVDLTQTVYHLAQAGSDKVWASRRIAVPTEPGSDPMNIASYTLEVTALDANAIPVPNAIVQVISDQPATIVTSNLSYQISPSSAATLATTPAGSLAITIESASLTSPLITLSTHDGSVTRWCQGDMVQTYATDTDTVPPSPSSVAARLNGQDANFSVTQATLQAANLMNSNYADPAGAINAITATGQWMAANTQASVPTIDTSQLRGQHWRIEFQPGSPASYRSLSEEEAKRLVGRVGPGDLGSSVSRFFGDAAHYFKHEWQELKSFTATVVDDMLTIVFNDALSFVVKTVREATAGLEAIFSAIAQGLEHVYDEIKAVVNWLKQLFDWSDILNTHALFKAAIKDASSKLPALAGAFQATVDSDFQTASKTVATYFDNLESYFEPGQSTNQYVNGLGPNPASGPSGNSLDGAALTTAHAQHASRSGYVMNKAQAHYASTPTSSFTSFQARFAADDLLSQLLDAVSANWDNDTVSTKAQSVQTYLKNNVSKPADFFDLIIVDLLEAAKDLVLYAIDGAKAVIDAIFTIVGNAFQQLIDAINAPIDIPILTWLYRKITTSDSNPEGDQLTLLDLLCLIYAVPTTIVYKVLFGKGANAPFQHSDVAAVQTQGLPWPSVSTASDKTGVSYSAAALGQPSDLVAGMGVGAGILSILAIPLTAYADNQAASQPSFLPSVDKAYGDSELPGFTTFVSYCSVIQTLLSQITGAPWSTFQKTERNHADNWTISLWAFSWAPFFYETAFTLSTKKLARYSELGPGLDTGVAWLLSALALTTIVFQCDPDSGYSRWDMANTMLPQPGRGFKFLIPVIQDDEEPTSKAATMLGLMIADVALGVGCAITQIGSVVADDH